MCGLHSIKLILSDHKWSILSGCVYTGSWSSLFFCGVSLLVNTGATVATFMAAIMNTSGLGYLQTIINIHLGVLGLVIIACKLSLFIRKDEMMRLLNEMPKRFMPYNDYLSAQQRQAVDVEGKRISKICSHYERFISMFTVFYLVVAMLSDRSIYGGLLFDAWYPFNKGSTLVVNILNIFQILSVIFVVAFMNFMPLNFMHLAGFLFIQLKILRLSIENDFQAIESRKGTLNTSFSSNTNISGKIWQVNWKRCVKHQVLIYEYLTEFNTLYTTAYICCFLSNILLIASGSFLLVFGNGEPRINILSFLALLPEILIPIIFCWYSQNITDEAENLRDTVFYTPWMVQSVEIQKLVLMTLIRCKRKIQLSSYTVTLDHCLLSKMLKSTYSLINLLITIKIKNGI